MTQTPLFTDIARAPPGGKAQWQTCADGVRIRIATWNSGRKGTILIFPGRTEYIEKYGPVVQSILARGYSAAVVDWRGQGLADRLYANHQLGHVKHFHDYQYDVDAMLKVVQDAGLPAPHSVLAHSMGGAIALRAMHNGLNVEKVIFSSPMWGIYIAPLLRLPAKLISDIGPYIGFAKYFSPNSNALNYVQANPFIGNTLTNDAETYHWLITQLDAHPELGIGGPSINWLHQAFAECAKLRQMPPPKHECLCFLGGREMIVSPKAITQMMGHWPNGKLVHVDGAQHEIFMEEQHVLNLAWQEVDRFLAL